MIEIGDLIVENC